MKIYVLFLLKKNYKALVSLTSYLYLTMNEKFNQYLFESNSKTYKDEKYDRIDIDKFLDSINTVPNLED